MIDEQLKKDFSKRREALLPLLPRCYAEILKSNDPLLNKRKLYNVKDGKVYDWDILQKMESLVAKNKK